MGMERVVYKELASSMDARIRCGERSRTGTDVDKENGRHWYERHTAYIQRLMRNLAPSGSGIDNGTQIDLDRSTGEKLVLNTAFHHMDEHGSYDEWTDHTVIVTASLIHGLNIKITGRNRNDIKEYLRDVFYDFLKHVFTEEQAKTFAGVEE